MAWDLVCDVRSCSCLCALHASASSQTLWVCRVVMKLKAEREKLSMFYSTCFRVKLNQHTDEAKSAPQLSHLRQNKALWFADGRLNTHVYYMCGWDAPHHHGYLWLLRGLPTLMKEVITSDCDEATSETHKLSYLQECSDMWRQFHPHRGVSLL